MRCWIMGWILLIAAGVAAAGELTAVGVLANTNGLSDQPIPYATYEAVAVDAQGRVYLGGPLGVVPVANQDGTVAALLPTPAGTTVVGSFCRAGGIIWLLAGDGRQATLCRIDTTREPLAIVPTGVILGGQSRLGSPAPADGSLLLLDAPHRQQTKPTVAVKRYATATGELTTAFSRELEGTAGWHTIAFQPHPDGRVRVDLRGQSNLTGWFDAAGQPAAELPAGQVVGDYLYQPGYVGRLRRFALDGSPAPGECGSDGPEIRHARQIAAWTAPDGTERFFFAGRGGSLEAAWNGTTFVYHRRIGAFWVQDMTLAGQELSGLAYPHNPHADIRRAFTLNTTKPLGAPLTIGTPYYTYTPVATVAGPQARIIAWERGGKAGIAYELSADRGYDVELPGVSRIGQLAVQGGWLYIVDAANGRLLRRPAAAKEAEAIPVALPVDPGPLTAVAFDEQGRLYVASATAVAACEPDGDGWRKRWQTATDYRGIRRLAAAGGRLFVCDTAGHVVDQLDAGTGAMTARLGTLGEAGADLRHLDGPVAIAADPLAVYIADNGNGRIVVATDTAWRPTIERLPRADAAPLAATRFTVDVPKAGKLSVTLFDEQGTVRQLVAGEAVGAGRHELLWDGRDDLGNFGAPGTYTFHGAIAPELSLRYINSLTQSGQPPHRTPDGTGSWGGVWGYVADICPVSDAPDTDIVVIWIYEEGEGCLIRMSQDGQVRWKQHGQWTGWAFTTVVSDGQTIYVGSTLREGHYKAAEKLGIANVWRVDAATGRYLDGSSHWKSYGPVSGNQITCHDIAVRDGRFYVTNTPNNELTVADCRTGELIATWKLPGVSGLTFLADGTLLASLGRRIVALDANGQVSRELVADAGGDIWDIERTAAGELVATVGEPRHQVVYYRLDGQELRTLGVAGGRPLCGKMQPADFRDPAGVGVMPDGTIFVAELAAPKRFTRWSPAGELQKEFHGPYYYSGMFGVDEENPEFIYADTHRDLIRYRVDYATGTWSVDSYWIGVYNVPDSGPAPIKWWPRIRHRDGRTFWCGGSGGIVELMDGGFRHIAAVWGGPARLAEDGTLERGHQVKSDLMATWSDLNGDGRAQPEEYSLTESAYPAQLGKGPQNGWGCYFDASFNLYMHDWSDSEATGGIWLIPVHEWREGVPTYRWDEARHVAIPRRDWPQHGGGGIRTAFAHGDAVYGFTGAYNAAGLPGVGHGNDWELLRIAKYDPATAKPLWLTGMRAPGFAAAGQLYCPTGAAGMIGELLFWTDENSLIHVFDDRHGLWLTSLLEDITRGPAPGPYTIWVELFNSRVFRHRDDGKVYLLAASDAIHLYEVLGTDQEIVRLTGTVTLDEAGIASVMARLQESTVSERRTYAIPRTADATANGEPVAMALSDDAKGTARLAYDDRFLYVAFDVDDASPLANGGSAPFTAFKTGDSLHLYLGTRLPDDHPRGQPVAGDVHLLFTRQGGELLTVGYWPVSEQKQPQVFRSPAGQTHLDRVAVLPEVKTVFEARPGGYRLAAAIPLDRLGLAEVQPGTKIGLDFALNFSDPAGQTNVAKLFWASNTAGIVYDLPTEARLEPAKWGTGVFK